MPKMMWESEILEYPQNKPKQGQEVLAFCQGYGFSGNYWCDWQLATYGRYGSDGRKCVFANSIAVRADSLSPWIYGDVTHFVPLPGKPAKVRQRKKR